MKEEVSREEDKEKLRGEYFELMKAVEFVSFLVKECPDFTQWLGEIDVLGTLYKEWTDLKTAGLDDPEILASGISTPEMAQFYQMPEKIKGALGEMKRRLELVGSGFSSRESYNARQTVIEDLIYDLRRNYLPLYNWRSVSGGYSRLLEYLEQRRKEIDKEEEDRKDTYGQENRDLFEEQKSLSQQIAQAVADGELEENWRDKLNRLNELRAKFRENGYPFYWEINPWVEEYKAGERSLAKAQGDIKIAESMLTTAQGVIQEIEERRAKMENRKKKAEA